MVTINDCSDADGDTLTYQETQSSFTFANANSGALTLQSQLDYDTLHYHTFPVTVSDGTNVATVTVFVTVRISEEAICPSFEFCYLDGCETYFLDFSVVYWCQFLILRLQLVCS